jgi:basic membrane protein A
MDWTVNVAAEYPNVFFAHCSGYKQTPNMSSYFGKIYQARYLSGIAAGKNTKNGKIGYVAAFPIPEVIRGINAFTLGVQSVNSSATVEVIWTNTWFDPALERQAAVELLNKGCDLIAQHQDTTAPQIAAQEKGALAIGYNVSTPTAAPRAYLTAPLFHWEVFYVSDVQKILDGTWASRAVWEGIETGMVSVDTITQLAAAGTKEAVQEAEGKLKAGTLTVFAGPLYDQSGAVKIAAGTSMSDDDVWNMGWLVKGVIGNVPAN